MRHSSSLIVVLLLVVSAPTHAADVADAIAHALHRSKRDYWSLSVQFHDLSPEEPDAGLLLRQREIEPAWKQLEGFDSHWTIGLHFQISMR